MFYFSCAVFATVFIPSGITEKFNSNKEATDRRGYKINTEMLPHEKRIYNHFNTLAGNVIPIIQTKKIGNAPVRKSFDEFAMERRKTYFTLPQQNYRDIPRSVNYNKTAIRHNHRTNETEKNVSLEQVNNIPENSINFEDPRLYKVLRKQTELIEKLVRVLNVEEHDNNTQLQLIEKQDAKKYEAISTLKLQATETEITTKKMSTIKSMIDETEVRQALQNDPYVKRILKMAHKRREDYIKAAKKYFKKISVGDKNTVH